MSTKGPELIVRHPKQEDAEAIHALMVRCDVAEYGSPDSDMEDLQHDWGMIDLNQDAWLIQGTDGHLFAYAALLPWGPRDVRIEFRVDPSWKSPALGGAMLAQAEARAPGFNESRGVSNDELTLHSFIAHVNQRDQETIEGSGYRPGKYYFQMQVETAGDLPHPSWPNGVSVRSAAAGVDERTIYEVVEASFAKEGRERTEYEDWVQHLLRPEIYDPELWLLAVVGEEIVGVCLGVDYPSGGWIRQLGVMPDWRRRGIATALLQESFRVFKKRGVATVGLSVESERPDAVEFYRRVGMKQVRQYDEYVKEIR